MQHWRTAQTDPAMHPASSTRHDRRSLRRLLAAVGVLAVVAAGSVVTAEAASAHATLLTGGAACQPDGTYSVTYTLQNDYNLAEDVTLKSSSGGGTLTGLPFTVAASPGQPYSSVTVTQTGVPGSTTSASLTVVGRWTDGYTQTDAALVRLPGDCRPATLPPPRATDETCSGANVLQNGSISVTPVDGVRYYYAKAGSNNEPTPVDGSVSLPAGTYTVTADRGERQVDSWSTTIAAAACTTPPPPVIPPPVTPTPTAEVSATCVSANITLANPTVSTVTFEIEHASTSETHLLVAGDTTVVTYSPSGNPYTVTVLANGTEIASATTANLTCLEAVVVPRAKPPTMEPAVIPTPVPAELPRTGAGSLPLALAGGGLFLLGSLLVAASRRRRGDLSA